MRDTLHHFGNKSAHFPNERHITSFWKQISAQKPLLARMSLISSHCSSIVPLLLQIPRFATNTALPTLHDGKCLDGDVRPRNSERNEKKAEWVVNRRERRCHRTQFGRCCCCMPCPPCYGGLGTHAVAILHASSPGRRSRRTPPASRAVCCSTPYWV